MTKQLALSLCAGLLLSLPGCGCGDSCSKKTETTVTTENTETSVDATPCAEATCESCETKSVEETAPAKF